MIHLRMHRKFYWGHFKCFPSKKTSTHYFFEKAVWEIESIRKFIHIRNIIKKHIFGIPLFLMPSFNELISRWAFFGAPKGWGELFMPSLNLPRILNGKKTWKKKNFSFKVKIYVITWLSFYFYWHSHFFKIRNFWSTTLFH